MFRGSVNGGRAYAILGGSIILAVAGFAFWQQSSDSRSGLATIPTLSAEPAPIRVKPDHPGGAEFPNQGQSIYGVLDGSAGPSLSQSSLAPSAETPITMPSNKFTPPMRPSQAGPLGVESILP